MMELMLIAGMIPVEVANCVDANGVQYCMCEYWYVEDEPDKHNPCPAPENALVIDVNEEQWNAK